ncbi:GNAT family N-acetyltransferase [Citreicoccus inhibens]|uniref:GNAT family N-acetyltransferase n=1 Tax=Citreicoccus inhibens TaxID=2849499 RepID=UPI002E2C8F1A|nr:GNAT family N-acetyltransferase [Citreicoccus inhibens]
MSATAHVIVRRLRPEEAERVRALRQLALRESARSFGALAEEDAALPIEEMRVRLGAEAPEERVAVGAFLGDSLVGVVGLRREARHKTRHKATVWGMYVAPEARGTGVGRRLLQALIEEGRRMPGVERLLLAVVADNAAARSLYLSLGFEPYGLERRALRMGDTYLDEEFMALSLGEGRGRGR